VKELVAIAIVVGLNAAGLAAFAAYRLFRRWRARARFAAVEAGERCAACGSGEVGLRSGWVSCQKCGYSVTLEVLRQEPVSARALADVTALDLRRVPTVKTTAMPEDPPPEP
jgi:hypothetical protein